MINTKELAVWGGGIGAGKVINVAADYAEQAMPTLAPFYFKELVSLVAGPALVGVAWKLSRGRHEAEADLAGLAGVEMFIDRIVDLGKSAVGIHSAPMGIRRAPQAPPPGFGVQHSPFTATQRLPFQSDLSY